MFFEGITTPKVCIKIELSRREWVSVLLLVIFDDFGMIWIPNDQLGLLSANPLYFHNLKILRKTDAIFL